jgi:hypothetical protein
MTLWRLRWGLLLLLLSSLLPAVDARNGDGGLHQQQQ